MPCSFTRSETDCNDWVNWRRSRRADWPAACRFAEILDTGSCIADQTVEVVGCGLHMGNCRAQILRRGPTLVSHEAVGIVGELGDVPGRHPALCAARRMSEMVSAI